MQQGPIFNHIFDFQHLYLTFNVYIRLSTSIFDFQHLYLAQFLQKGFGVKSILREKSVFL